MAVNPWLVWFAATVALYTVFGAAAHMLEGVTQWTYQVYSGGAFFSGYLAHKWLFSR